MRFIPTRVHGILDYAGSAFLLGTPWFFQFDHGSAETWFPIIVAAGAMLYSMFTDYEWSVSRAIPMRVHLMLDMGAGLLLAASPWIFGFSHTVFVPHLTFGIIEIVIALFTSTHPTERSYAGVKRLTVTGLLVLGASGCDRAPATTYQVTTVAGQVLDIKSAARLITTISGLHDPESALYDAEQDVIFISNMHGDGSDKDGHGYIVRVAAGDYANAQIFVEGGRNGAVLDAPKGMTLRDSVLWVTDIDVLRGFHRRTGAPVGVIDMRSHGAILLNDVATAPDGSLYVTDSAIRMTAKGTIYQNGDRIFAIAPSGAVTMVAQGEQLRSPNGIQWHAGRQRWLVAAFDPFQSMIYELPARAGEPVRVIAQGPGNFDGLQILEDGSIVVTCWADYSLHLLRDGRQSRIAGNIYQPADLGLDTRRHRLLVPSVILGRVEVWLLNG